jgi:hypothetical protein
MNLSKPSGPSGREAEKREREKGLRGWEDTWRERESIDEKKGM